MRRFLLASAFLIGSIAAAHAQSPSVGMVQISPGNFEPLGPSNALSVNTLQVVNFTPGNTTSIAAALPAVSGKTNYLCGFTIDALASAATNGFAVITGLTTASVQFGENVNASTGGYAQLYRTFFPCLPASGSNVAISIATLAPGAGGNQNVTIWGYVR